MDPAQSTKCAGMKKVSTRSNRVGPICEQVSPKVDLAKMKMLRRRKGISQRDMATTLGYRSAVGYHYLETGRCAIQAEQLFLIARRLDVPIGELFLRQPCTDRV